eukprot:CAMPEP_0181459686 /NCGR_PEP_ID=MMETSP1110-20121109/32953_1 /TAXON_ID=174948 /ORGANISM="Symbiodinium sp., Strain CCMP421" /LENGTH=339 /DNA_ID=CAMNT_0023584213 /DNA_START=38 /DNA_END=1054 /DNA_ORIENTATION=+
MAGQYKISLRNSFLHFASHETGADRLSRATSCPDFASMRAKANSLEDENLDGRACPAHAVHYGAPTNFQEMLEKGTQAKGKLLALGRQDSVSWKKINHELSEAAKIGSYEKILSVVEKKLPEMNGINFATAIHRRAKATSMTAQSCAMLDAVERIAHCELQRGGEGEGHVLSGGCSSIVAWSCATLGAFRLFHSCQDFEVTNLLWAFGQLRHFVPEAGKLAPQIQELLDATAQIFTRQRLRGMKAHVLISAMVSLATLRRTGSAAALQQHQRGAAEPLARAQPPEQDPNLHRLPAARISESCLQASEEGLLVSDVRPTVQHPTPDHQRSLGRGGLEFGA